MNSKIKTLLTAVVLLVIATASVRIFHATPIAANNNQSITPGTGAMRAEKSDNRELTNATQRQDAGFKENYLKSYSFKKFTPLLTTLSLKLAPDKIVLLKDILATREIIYAEAKTGAQSAKKSIPEYLDIQSKQIRGRISNELSEEVAQVVDKYIQTLPLRKTLNEMNQIMIYNDASMSASMTEKLCTLISETDVAPRPRASSLADVDAYIKAKETAYSKIPLLAADFMSKAQIEILRRELEMDLLHLKSQRTDIFLASSRSR